jgi:hypothetical protein
MSDQIFINETEFDSNLKRISDAYELVKDALYCGPTHDMRVYEALSTLRDFAATGLKSQHQIKDNN